MSSGVTSKGDAVWTRRPFNVWAVIVRPSEVILSIYEGKEHVEKVGRLAEFKPSGRTQGYSERVVYDRAARNRRPKRTSTGIAGRSSTPSSASVNRCPGPCCPNSSMIWI